MTEEHLQCNVAEYAVVVDSQKRYLVLRLIDKIKDIGGKWNLPGGRMNTGEQAVETLIRETKEETGLDIEPSAIIHSTFNFGTYRIFYYCHAKDDAHVVTLSKEHQEYRWATMEELEKLDFVGFGFFEAIQKTHGFLNLETHG